MIFLLINIKNSELEKYFPILEKEVNALGAAVDRGWTTNAAAAQRMFGTEFDSNAEELERENKRMQWKEEASTDVAHEWAIDSKDNQEGEDTE